MANAANVNSVRGNVYSGSERQLFFMRLPAVDAVFDLSACVCVCVSVSEIVYRKFVNTISYRPLGFP